MADAKTPDFDAFKLTPVQLKVGKLVRMGGWDESHGSQDYPFATKRKFQEVSVETHRRKSPKISKDDMLTRL